MKPKKRILLVDDHPVVRTGIARLLQESGRFDVVGQASDGYEGVSKAIEQKPDVVLMDLRMPRYSGLEAIRLLTAKCQEVAILVLTVSENDRDLFSAIKAGAKGYLLKTSENDEIVRAIELVCAGQAAMSPLMATKMLSEFSRNSEGPGAKRAACDTGALTERELDILTLVARGSTNREIAQSLSIAENTVRTHLHNILEKLHCNNRTEAAILALHEGLVPEASQFPAVDA